MNQMLKLLICINFCVIFTVGLCAADTAELLQAIRTHDFKQAETLLEKGAPVDSDTWGTNPLYSVLESDDFQMFMLLLYHRADAKRLTAFDYALSLGEEKMVRLLAGWYTEKYPNLDERNLRYAVAGGNTNVIRLVLQNGKYTNFPLDTAAISGHTDAIRLLLDYGANPDAVYLNGHPAADTALKNGNAEVALLLLLR
jgi:ankyrin repeat protein